MKFNRAAISASVITALALAVAPSVHAAGEQDGDTGYTIYPLGTLGGSTSSGNAINNEGWAMGNANLQGDQATHATVWIDDLKFDLGTFGGPNSAIEWPVKNNHGIIAGIAETASLDKIKENWSCSAFFPSIDHHVCVGFRYADGAMTPLPTLGGPNGYASGVSRHGQIVGWAESTTSDPTCVAPQVLQFEAVHYSRDGKLSVLPPLVGDSDGAATAINDAGQAVGISGSCDNAVGAYTAAHAVIWQNGAARHIKTFGGKGWNTPADINELGQVVGFADLPGDVAGGTLNFNPVGFIWSADAGIHKIKPLAGDTNSIAYAINDKGEVAAQSFGGLEGSRAFVWHNGKARDLNAYLDSASGLYLLYAEGINDRGEITGQACVVVNGACTTTEAFLAVPAGNSETSAAARGGSRVAMSGVTRELLYRPLRQRGLAVSATERAR